ncbi:MVP isoform 15 [Pan troglodytes]|uniref:Major vault protein n=12 Tax=Simiiformes TaxID=314293 RepID=H3BPZ2_HUMAN|nr:MVP isoform 15 [Pan troglodytes]
MATEEFIIRIPPYHYIHVLDQNSNVSRVECPAALGRSGW